MNQNEDYFLSHNKLLEEKLDYCVHSIESRLDKLYEVGFNQEQNKGLQLANKQTNPFSSFTYLQFKAPYIRDFRNFSGPANDDVKQIRDLTGTDNIDVLIKNKSWSKESKQQLCDAILDYYAKIHIIELIKQKNDLRKQLDGSDAQTKKDIEQKLSLIEEQTDQVISRKEQRIFVPETKNDSNIDWCAISARLATTHHDPQDCRLMWSNNLHWSINNGLWTKEEDECLLNAVQKFGKNDWDSVANELNSNRIPWQCCARYNQELNSLCGTTPINEDDTDKIVEVINLCRIGNFVPWNQVMYFIQYHSLLQVKYQWHKLLSEKRSNQSWSHEEDVLLLRTIDKFGNKDWNRIANYIPGRSNKSCRERYTMRLKFQKRAIGCWKPKEDKILLSLIEKFGTNWSLISSHFPERNNHQIRNRYELLKNEVGRIGPIKHKKLYRNSDGQLISLSGRRQKLSSEREVDEKLNEILTSYQHIKPSSRSLICRSAQDEYIYQNLIQVIRKGIAGREIKHNLLSSIIEKAIKDRVSSKYELFTPSLATLRGYKAWMMQQDYLNQFSDDKLAGDINLIQSTTEYNHILKIVMSIFLWPSILSKIRRPDIDVTNFQVGSIIERDSKNLYKIRDIQKQIASQKQ